MWRALKDDEGWAGYVIKPAKDRFDQPERLWSEKTKNSPFPAGRLSAIS